MTKLSADKARKILHHGTVRGKPITEKQRRFFGATASGKARKPDGGKLDFSTVTHPAVSTAMAIQRPAITGKTPPPPYTEEIASTLQPFYKAEEIGKILEENWDNPEFDLNRLKETLALDTGKPADLVEEAKNYYLDLKEHDINTGFEKAVSEAYRAKQRDYSPYYENEKDYMLFLTDPESSIHLSRIPYQLIEDIVSSAKKYNVDPYTMLALVGKESTFGSGMGKGRRQSGTGLASAWHGLNRYLGNTGLSDYILNNPDKARMPWGKIERVYDPGLKKYRIKNIADSSTRRSLLDMYEGYISRRKDDIAGELSEKDYFDTETEAFLDLGLKGYNPGQHNYVEMVDKIKQRLMENEKLTRYINQLGGPNAGYPVESAANIF